VVQGPNDPVRLDDGGARAASVPERTVAADRPGRAPESARPAAARAPAAGHSAGDLQSEQIYAALDLGTNNCRLLVARPSRRSFHVVDAFSRIIRLGEGLSQSGVLSEPAMARTLDALEVCADKMRRRGVTRSRLVATEACRIARNGDEFLERVRKKIGLNLEIVSRETEARLAVSGCASLIDRRARGALVFDIGGGSSELIWLDFSGESAESYRLGADRGDVQDKVAAWTSLPLGVVTLSETFGGRHVDQGVFEAMVNHVLAMLNPFEQRHAIAQALRERDAHLLGTSGTVTTVAGIHLGLKAYDRSRVDGCWLHTDQVRQVAGRLLDTNYEGRVAEPCIGRDRADLVLAGCAILEALLRTWPCPRLRVADRGLREGILSRLMVEDDAHRCRAAT
jgi:exopolyphosphatase / guanosine-5'-triphosphate,3'-diphosphate pyrophosphatase